MGRCLEGTLADHGDPGQVQSRADSPESDVRGMTPAPRQVPDSAVRALLLAAGSSRRFGGDKLLYPLAGRPLVTHAATAIAEAIAGGILRGAVAVVPSGETKLAWHLDTLGMDLVPNPDPARGLSSSLRLGLAALEQSGAPAALVFLADQPFVRAEVVTRLVLHWQATGRSVRPRYAGAPETPGHPVLLDRAVWRLADDLVGDTGLGDALERHGAAIDELPCDGENPDIDTPADLRGLGGFP